MSAPLLATISLDWWYQALQALSGVLPGAAGDWAADRFMANALLAVILITPTLGALGVLVLANRMAFFTDAVGHSALTGIAVGVLFGLANPVWAMIAFAAAVAAGIAIVRAESGIASDTVIGVFFATTVAVGVVLLERLGGIDEYSHYIVGDIFIVTPGDIALVAAVDLVVILFLVGGFNKLLLTTINTDLAHSRGIPIEAIQVLFSVIVAVVVTVCLQWVGLLLVNSLLILPAAAARNRARSMRSFFVLAVVVALAAGIGGLVCSYYLETSGSGTITLFAAGIFFVALACRRRQPRGAA